MGWVADEGDGVNAFMLAEIQPSPIALITAAALGDDVARAVRVGVARGQVVEPPHRRHGRRIAEALGDNRAVILMPLDVERSSIKKRMVI